MNQVQLFDHEAELLLIQAICLTSATEGPTQAYVLFEKARMARADFEKPLHGAAWEAIGRILLRSESVNPLFLKSEIEAKEPAGFLTSGPFKDMWHVLVEAAWGEKYAGLLIAADKAVETLAKKIHSFSVRRSGVHDLDRAREQLFDLSTDEDSVLQEVTGRLAKKSTRISRIKRVQEMILPLTERMDEIASGKRKPILKTGIRLLDDVLGGYQETLITVGALPGVGKSALLAAFSFLLAKRQVNHAVFSLEDNPDWLAWRLLSRQSGIDQHTLRFEPNKLFDIQDKDRREERMKRVDSAFENVFNHGEYIYTVDGSDEEMSPDEIIQTSNFLILNHGVKVIFIDHIGEIDFGAADSELHSRKISKFLRRARGISNRTGVPVVIFAHLKVREGLTPGTKPTINDFADSAGIGRKSRVCILLSRKEGSDLLMAHIMKQTMGKANIDVPLPFHGISAMVSEVEGVGR